MLGQIDCWNSKGQIIASLDLICMGSERVCWGNDSLFSRASVEPGLLLEFKGANLASLIWFVWVFEGVGWEKGTLFLGPVGCLIR